MQVVSKPVLFYMYHTNSLWSKDLSEACGKGDEDNGVGDPGQVLQEHITVQTTVHPLLCCGHKPGQTCKATIH